LLTGPATLLLLLLFVSTPADAFQESLATLRFADRARNIANRAVVNSAHDTDTILAIKVRAMHVVFGVVAVVFVLAVACCW
jgi:hypothetical protein